MRISNETKDEIIKSYNEKIPSIEIIKKFNISKATYYRIIKNLKDKSNENSNNITLNDSNDNKENNTDNTDNENIDNDNKDNSDNENQDNNNENSENENKDNDNDNQDNKSDLNKIDNENIEKFNDNNDFDNDNDSEFNRDKFKRILNENKNIEKKATKKKNLKKPLIDVIPVETVKEEVKTILEPSIINDNNLSIISKVSKVSFVKNRRNNNNNFINNNNSSVNNRSNIIDTIKQVNTGDDIDSIKMKRHLITKIKQFCNEFPEELRSVYINKINFDRKLLTLTEIQLRLILEDIYININLMRNKTMFSNCVHTGLKSFEIISNYIGFDITGVSDDLFNDQDFLFDLRVISCEIDMSKYINPKSAAFMKVIKKVYQKHQENKIKNQINNVINDPVKLEKIINLDKK